MIKLLLIGVGRWGMNHLRVLKEISGEVYIADSNVHRLLSACEKFAIPSTHASMNYGDFLNQVDGIVIATPADSHYDICMRCFEKGKDVFVEKPIALNSILATWMVKQARKQKLVLQVGHIYRYHPATQKIKEMIKNLGTIRYAYGHFMGFKRPRMDVGVTQTDAIHYFDLFNYLLDETPRAVTAVTRCFLSLPFYTDDTSISILDYDGKVVCIEAGYLPPETRRDITIIGDKASLYCNFRMGFLVLHNNWHIYEDKECLACEGEKQVISIGQEKPLALELQAFIESIKNRTRPLADGEAGLEALKIVEHCYRSSIANRRIDL